jgi:hypothetical protein
MIQIHASTKAFVLGTAKKVVLFVAVDARSVAKLKGRWFDGNASLELSANNPIGYVGVLFERKVCGITSYSGSFEQNS